MPPDVTNIYEAAEQTFTCARNFGVTSKASFSMELNVLSDTKTSELSKFTKKTGNI